MLKLAIPTQEIEDADLVVNDNGHSEEDPLETAAIITMFTNRRAKDEDVPMGVDRQGWWADVYKDSDDRDDSLGSRLWLLEGAPDTQETIDNAKQYLAEAFQWWLDNGVASSVVCDAARLFPGCLGLSVEITRPNETTPHKLGPWRFFL